MNHQRICNLCIAGVLAATASCSSQPESHGEKLRVRMSQWTDWVQDHRKQLEILLPGAGRHATLQVLAWPRPPRSHSRFLTVRGKAGHLNLYSEQRLYLEPDVCLVIPSREKASLLAHYASWAANWQEAHGDLCNDLGGGWYLCSDREGTGSLSRSLTDPQGSGPLGSRDVATTSAPGP
jgi:hypothetical protein